MAAKVQVQVNQVTVNAGACGDPDQELATLIAAITDGFSEEKISYFRQLAAGNSRTRNGQHFLTGSPACSYKGALGCRPNLSRESE
jgi:hypothetical protein